MGIKLQYDPKRALKLSKNEILNEFRTKYSHKIYEAFKEAETQIWLDKDQNFQFLDDLVHKLEDELNSIRESLNPKAQAWSSVEKAELKLPGNKIQVASRKSSPVDTSSAFNTVDYFDSPSKKQTTPKEIQEEEFDFFDEI
jgi:hypothetical protein